MSKSLYTAAFVVAIAVLASEPALAQCAMCRTALEQNGAEVAVSFNRAILFLLGMPYLVFGTIAGSWYLKRRRRDHRETAVLSSAK